MRLWHKDLIDVLPRQQLLGQWRELCAIMRNIEAKGTQNHILVNKVLSYPPNHLNVYARAVADEMAKRGYRCDFSKFSQHMEKHLGISFPVSVDKVFPNWHNDRYLRQCYYNLQEKHDCGGITDEEWQRVEDRCREVLGDKL